MSDGYFPKRTKLSLDDLWRGLITASHILHYHDVLDAYGHISVRNPDNPETFYMPRNLAPALISTVDDIVEYKVEDASAVEKNAPKGYLERFIHSEIYKRFPTVNSVVHSHSVDVLPYCVSEVPLKATTHMAGFLGVKFSPQIPHRYLVANIHLAGTSVPVWDIASSYSSGDSHGLLVRSSALGHSLSAAFKPSTSTSFIYSKVRSALPSQIAGHAPEPSSEPDHPVVLMRGHGFATCAASVEQAVFQSIYTCQAAKVQTTALSTRTAWFGGHVDGKVNVDAGGKFQGGKVTMDKDIRGLAEKEAKDAWTANKESVHRPWELWCREVETCPLYVNSIKSEE
jgi:ribulose-5-phosphate 4-epimerase/fuculose-1-phosphate aldolase